MSFILVGDRSAPVMVTFIPGELKRQTKVFFFDLDWTLLHPTKSFISQIYDFHLLPERVSKLLELISEGFEIVIVTSNIGKTVEFVEAKIMYFFDLITKETGFPFSCTVLCSLDERVKKPITWIYDYYKSQINPNVIPKESCFCGDAAGRTYTDLRTEIVYMIDYSSDDLDFAKNIGVKFYTPDELFKFSEISVSGTQEIVLMMGMPGSEKSWISRNIFVDQRGYKIVQQDFLKSYPRCLSTTQYYIEQGFSVVVDNTNPMAVTRRGYIDIAKHYNIRIRLIYIAEDGFHINKQKPNPVPIVAFNTYFGRLEYPDIKEGFDELIIYWQKTKDVGKTELRRIIEEELVPPISIQHPIKKITIIKGTSPPSLVPSLIPPPIRILPSTQPPPIRILPSTQPPPIRIIPLVKPIPKIVLLKKL